jgi:hypothetical protein
MARLSHKAKVKKARKMLRRAERMFGTAIFDSIAWNQRHNNRFLKEATRIQEARERRKELANG